MKKPLILLLLSAFVVIGACKKESAEVHTCPEIDVPYVSVKTQGDTAERIKVVIFNKVVDNYNDAQCAGAFMWVVGTGDLGDPDPNVNFYKVTNELSDSVLNNTNYGNSEWYVDVRYLGVGMECYVDAHLVDPKPGEEVLPNEVELVEITNIEPVL